MLHWEYWPAAITNIPVVLFWLYFALRSRDLFFFSRVNPVIETGGVLGESKISILERIPKQLIPATIFVRRAHFKKQDLLLALKKAEIKFPIICKPNVGERGFLVEKIDGTELLIAYFDRVKVDFLIQTFVDLPAEYSILCHRFPDQERATITSICMKEYLTVTGDGLKTVKQLIGDHPRASLQLKRMSMEKSPLLKSVPRSGEEILLEPIGNHCRGTKFLNANHLITDELEDFFSQLMGRLDGIYYGRFDLKCKSLCETETLRVLEFNGVASEPAHIYDPEYPLYQGYRDVFDHWKIIYQISKAQKVKGVESMSFSEAWMSLRDHFFYLRKSKRDWQAAG